MWIRSRNFKRRQPFQFFQAKLQEKATISIFPSQQYFYVLALDELGNHHPLPITLQEPIPQRRRFWSKAKKMRDELMMRLVVKGNSIGWPRPSALGLFGYVYHGVVRITVLRLRAWNARYSHLPSTAHEPLLSWANSTTKKPWLMLSCSWSLGGIQTLQVSIHKWCI